MAYTNGSPIRKILVDEVIHPVHDYRILPKDYKLAELTQSLNQEFDADGLAMLNDASPETVFFVNDSGKHIVCSPTNTKEIQADGTIIPWVSTIDEKGEAFGIKCVFEDNVITSAKLVKMDSPYVKVAKGYMEVRTNQNPIKLTTQVMKPVEVGDTILGFEYVEEETECTLPPIEPIVHYPKSLLFTSPTPFTITTVQTETETPGWYGDGDLEVGVNGVDFTDITEINTPFTIESEFNFDLGSHALFIRGVGNSTLNNTKFKCSGNNVVLQGYLSAVLDWTEEAATIGEGAYVGVFSGSSAYTDCSGLIMPSILSEGALAGAFNNCVNLTVAPDLPAVELYEECYAEMFSGCTSLIKSPKLKAITLEPYCYTDMFNGCINLIIPPALPATTLAEGCYAGMFLGCTSLTTTPKLSAEILEPLCYQSMFDGCTGLITVNSFTPTTMAQSACSTMFAGCSKLTSFPDLTCTSLAEACYAGMFYGCTSLMITPTLPATTLAVNCYNEMFKGCTSIGTPAALPATSYPEGCYQSMFEGCTGIVWQSGTKGTSYRIPVTGTGSAPGTNAFTDMFKGNTFVSGAGMPESGIPTVNTDYYYSDFVIFKGAEPFALTLSSQFIYSVDDGVNWTVGYDVAIPSNANNEIWVKHNPAATYNRFRFANNTTIVITGDKVGIDGKLVDLVGPEIQCAYLFEGQTGLTDISKLIFPSYTRPQCYMGMFKGTSVDMPATLPATQLATNCYVSMFEDCVGISWSDKGQEYTVGVTGGDQNAVTNMFKGCSSTPTSTMPADGTPVLGETYYITEKKVTIYNTYNFNLTVNINSPQYMEALEYKTGDSKQWNSLALNTNGSITIPAAYSTAMGKYTVDFRGMGTSMSGIKIKANSSNNITGELEALLNYKGKLEIMGNRAFYDLFDASSTNRSPVPINLVFPDITSNYCYYSLFAYGGLGTPITLPATVLKPHCYDRMFYNSWVSNTKYPIIKGKEFNEGACNRMFSYVQNYASDPLVLDDIFENINSPDTKYIVLSTADSSPFYNLFESSTVQIKCNTPIDLCVDHGNPSIFASMFANYSGNDLSNIIFDASGDEIKCNLSSLCYECYSVQQVPKVNGLKSTTKMVDNQFSRTFDSCRKLPNVPFELPMVELTKGCYQRMFNCCYAIKQPINFPEFITPPPTTAFDLMFKDSGLTDICSYNGGKIIKYLGKEMYSETKITDLSEYKIVCDTIYKEYSHYKISYPGVFSECKQLTKLPDVSEWKYMNVNGFYNTGYSDFPEGVFRGCDALTGDIEINLHSTASPTRMFLSCKNVESITINYTSEPEHIDNCLMLYYACCGCDKLKSFKINGINSNTLQFYIEYAFNRCPVLEEVILNNNNKVKIMCGRQAFENTPELKRISFNTIIPCKLIDDNSCNMYSIFSNTGLFNLENSNNLIEIEVEDIIPRTISISNMYSLNPHIKLVGPDYSGAISFRIPNDPTKEITSTVTGTGVFKDCTFDATSTVPTTGDIGKNTTYYYVIE